MESKKARKRIDAALKAKVAVEAIKGQQTGAQIASQYGIHANQISTWKKQALQGLPEVFGRGKGKGKGSTTEGSEAHLSKLYEEIGRLKVELSWLEKKYAQLG